MMKQNIIWLIFLVFISLNCEDKKLVDDTTDDPPVTVKHGFPHIAGIVLNYSRYKDPNFHKEAAKAEILVFGFQKGWDVTQMRDVVKAIEYLNPNIKTGQYSNVVEVAQSGTAQAELKTEVDNNNWWVRTVWPGGTQVSGYPSTCEVNITAAPAPNANGVTWPIFYANWINNNFYKQVPEFDFWYGDLLNQGPYTTADWDQNGVTDDSNNLTVKANYRKGLMNYYNAVHQLKPGFPLMPNVTGDLSDPEYVGQFEYALYEATMGKSWSQIQDPADTPVNPRNNWSAMMTRYRALLKNTKEPHLVIFNAWGHISDPMTAAQQQWFRYCYTSCLMDNGYFCFTDDAVSYNSVPWNPEFDYVLGDATSAPPEAAWQNGVWMRTFENATVLVNPTATAQTVTFGDGTTVTIASKDGYIRKQKP